MYVNLATLIFQTEISLMTWTFLITRLKDADIFTKGTEIRTFSDKGTFHFRESCKWSEALADKLEGA